VCGKGGGGGVGSTRNDTPDVRTVEMTYQMVTGLFYFNQIHKYICIHIHIHIYVYVHMYVYVSMYLCMYTCLYVCVYVYVYVYVSAPGK